MSKVADARPAAAVLTIPEEAHFSLVQVAYFLRLMKQLTQPGTNASNYDAQLRPSALSWCFSSLSKEIDTIIDATYISEGSPSTAVVSTSAQRRKSRR